MNRARSSYLLLALLFALSISLGAVRPSLSQPPPQAAADFQQYAAALETRLARQHESPGSFLARDAKGVIRLRDGEVIIEQLSALAQPSGALLHNWRATAFAPGASVVQLEKLLRDFRAYPNLFAPEVIQTRAVWVRTDEARVKMRVQQKHVITVVMDASYDVKFGRMDSQHGYSASRSTRISEIGDAGTNHERVLTPGEEHGFLWNQNTYWSYERGDGGVYLQIESLSLSRSIPIGLGWALRPYVTSVPRESLEFTLRSAVKALRKQADHKEK